MKSPGVSPNLDLVNPEVVEVSPWCNSSFKRAWDFCWALLLLISLSPLMAFIALAVKLSSPGPVFFRQPRPGRGCKEFYILKFRSMMAHRREAGPVLTRADDPRVTRVGRLLRKWKLDELPQLFNVIQGDMSFIGPRPQVTRLWTNPLIEKEAACVLSVRPGITSQTTLAFRNEEELLSPFSSKEVEEIYLREIMPLKVSMEIDYLTQASFLKDLRIVLMTGARVFIPHRARDGFLKRQLEFAGASLGASLKNKAQSSSKTLPDRLDMPKPDAAILFTLREIAEALQSCETTAEFCMLLKESLMVHGFDGFGFQLHSTVVAGADCFPLQQAGNSRFDFFWHSSAQPSLRNASLTFPLQNGHRIGRFTFYHRDAKPLIDIKPHVFTTSGLSRELARAINRLRSDWLANGNQPMGSARRRSATMAGD